jgi:hypothetical protein
MGLSHHPKNLDHWMAVKVFLLLATKFGQGACNMFMESSRQALHKAIKGD